MMVKYRVRRRSLLIRVFRRLFVAVMSSCVLVNPAVALHGNTGFGGTFAYCDPLFCGLIPFLEISGRGTVTFEISGEPFPFFEGSTVFFNESSIMNERLFLRLTEAGFTGTEKKKEDSGARVHVGDAASVPFSSLLFDAPSPSGIALSLFYPDYYFGNIDIPAILPGGSSGSATLIDALSETTKLNDDTLLEFVFLDPEFVEYPYEGQDFVSEGLEQVAPETWYQLAQQNMADFGGNTVFSAVFDVAHDRVDVWAYRLDEEEFYLAASTAVVPVPAAAWLFGAGLSLLGWLRGATARFAMES